MSKHRTGSNDTLSNNISACTPYKLVSHRFVHATNTAIEPVCQTLLQIYKCVFLSGMIRNRSAPFAAWSARFACSAFEKKTNDSIHKPVFTTQPIPPALHTMAATTPLSQMRYLNLCEVLPLPVSLLTPRWHGFKLGITQLRACTLRPRPEAQMLLSPLDPTTTGI